MVAVRTLTFMMGPDFHIDNGPHLHYLRAHEDIFIKYDYIKYLMKMYT